MQVPSLPSTLTCTHELNALAPIPKLRIQKKNKNEMSERQLLRNKSSPHSKCIYLRGGMLFNFDGSANSYPKVGMVGGFGSCHLGH